MGKARSVALLALLLCVGVGCAQLVLGKRKANLPGSVQLAQKSGDGKGSASAALALPDLACVRDGNLCLRLSGGSVSQLTQQGGCRHPGWTSDGRRLVFEQNADIECLDLATGQVASLTKGTNNSHQPAVQPQSGKVYFVRATGNPAHAWLCRMAADGTAQEQLVQVADDWGQPGRTVWRPDGKLVAVSVQTGGEGGGEAYYDAAGGKVKQPYPEIEAAWWTDTPCWQPAGSLLAIPVGRRYNPDDRQHHEFECSMDLWDIAQAKWGKPIKAPSPRAEAALTDIRWPSFTADGAVLAYVKTDDLGGDKHQVWSEFYELATGRLLGRADNAEQPAWRPKPGPSVAATPATAGVTVGHGQFLMDVPAYEKDGAVFVPLRGIANWLGARTEFDPQLHQITLAKDGTVVKTVLGQREATLAGPKGQSTIQLAQPAMELDGTTMVPLRFVGDALQVTVKYVTEERSFAYVELSSSGKLARLFVHTAPPSLLLSVVVTKEYNHTPDMVIMRAPYRGYAFAFYLQWGKRFEESPEPPGWWGCEGELVRRDGDHWTALARSLEDDVGEGSVDARALAKRYGIPDDVIQHFYRFDEKGYSACRFMHFAGQ